MTPDRFAGALVGQCLGDAAGFMVEGCPPEVCARYVEQVLETDRIESYRRGPFAFGQYSDDSQLAREMMQSYVACRGFDPADYARRIAAIFADGRIVGRGRSTEEAAIRLAAGIPWQEAGTPPPSAGNGSAMRAGPVGLMFYDDEEGLLRAAFDQGRITHADPRCSAGAIAIAGAVKLALEEGPIEPHRFLATLAAWAGTREAGMGRRIGELESWIERPPEQAVTFIARAGLPEDHRHSWKGISPFVVGSVLWSLYAFLRSPEDYWRAVCTAIAVGGDVDTTAAMTGAIAGARGGLAAVPAKLAGRINDQGSWGYDALVELAHRVWQIKTGGA